MTAEESSTDEKMPPNEAESAATNAAAPKMDPETEPLTAGAMADPKVKFTGESETVDVEKGGQSGDDGIKPALTKAELMKYATDPFWVKLRWVRKLYIKIAARNPQKTKRAPERIGMWGLVPSYFLQIDNHIPKGFSD